MSDPAGASENGVEGTHHPRKDGLWALALGSVGVVFGDIGTSPLYAMREALAHSKGGGGGELAVLGVVSLITWALILIVTIRISAQAISETTPSTASSPPPPPLLWARASRMA